jgi:purine-binding chemotaxis protein CheW
MHPETNLPDDQWPETPLPGPSEAGQGWDVALPWENAPAGDPLAAAGPAGDAGLPPWLNPEVPGFDALPEAAAAADAAAPAEPAGPGEPAEPEQPPHRADCESLEGLAATPGLTDAVAALSDPQSLPELAVQVKAPESVQVGQIVSFEVRVTNTGSVPATGVQARTTLGVGLLHGRGPCLEADLGTLPPGKSKLVRFGATAAAPGRQASAAAVTFGEGARAQARATVTVAEPAAPQWSGPAQPPPELAVKVKAPDTVPVGRVVPFEVRVTNTGNVPATGVDVRIVLAAGLLHSRGSCLKADLGTLPPGKSKLVRFRATAVAPGPQASEGVVSCREDARAQIRATVNVTQAALQLRLSEPERTPLDDGLRFVLELSNPGLDAATGIQVQLPLPEGVEVCGDGGGADHDRVRRCLTWQRASLLPGRPWVVTAQLQVATAEEVRLQAEARADGGLHAQAEVRFTETQGPEEDLEPDPVRDGRLEELLAEMDRESEGPAAWGDDIFGPGSAPAGTDEGPQEQHIAFTLAGTEYTVPLGSVIEVVRPQRTTPLPNVPEWMTGLTNLRGDVISVVDLRTFLGMEPAALGNAGRMLVARSSTGDTTTGLLVDRVRRIIKLPARQIVAPAAPLEDQVAPYLRGVAERAGRLLVVLDLDRLLLSHEMRQFEPV